MSFQLVLHCVLSIERRAFPPENETTNFRMKMLSCAFSGGFACRYIQLHAFQLKRHVVLSIIRPAGNAC